jgi:hypothetical protein
MLSGLVSIAAALLMAVSGQPFVPLASAQAAPATPAQSIVDTWQGTLHAPGGKDLRTVLKITTGDKGELKVIFYTIDQTGQPFPTTSASFQDKVLKYAISGFDLTYVRRRQIDYRDIETGRQLNSTGLRAGNAGNRVEHSGATGCNSAHGRRCRPEL